MITSNININYSKENYLSFREGYKNLIPDLKNIVKEYLICVLTNSRQACEFYHDRIIVEDLNGNPVSKWPIQKIKEYFVLAFNEDNYEIASLFVSLNRIKLNENFEKFKDSKVNWLHKSIIDRKNNFFDALFESNQVNINKQTHIDSIFTLYAKNQSPLHLAISNKNSYALEKLLKNSTINLFVKNVGQYFPYEYAIKLSFGIEFFNKQFGEAYLFTNCADSSTLRIACENNAIEIAIPLTYRFDVNTIYNDYLTLLFSCVEKKSHSFILQALLTHPQMNPNLLCPFVYTRCTALHLALKINNMPAFRLLIAHPNINVDINESVENEVENVFFAISPLNTAIKQKNVEAVELLLNKKPKLTNSFRIYRSIRTVNSYHRGELMGRKEIEARSSHYSSALDLAKETENKEIIAMISAYSRTLENKERKN